MNPDDAFRVIPVETADCVVGFLAAAVLIFGPSPEFVSLIGRLL